MSAAIVVTVFTLHLGIEGAWAASSAVPSPFPEEVEAD